MEQEPLATLATFEGQAFRDLHKRVSSIMYRFVLNIRPCPCHRESRNMPLPQMLDMPQFRSGDSDQLPHIHDVIIPVATIRFYGLICSAQSREKLAMLRITDNFAVKIVFDYLDDSILKKWDWVHVLCYWMVNEEPIVFYQF
jgi:DUF971 family protein